MNPAAISSPHNGIYEAYYRLADPRQAGKVMALDAAKFLKKSGLSDMVLGKIWDIADVGAKGYLDKTGMFMAMKLVAAAQAGGPVDASQLGTPYPPPRLGDIPTAPTVLTPEGVIAQPPKTKWAMRPEEKLKYEQMFLACNPVMGKVPGSTVKPFMLKSKLPVDVLGKLWDLADIDKDGALDKEEFLIAMHLIAKCVEGFSPPVMLPPELTKGRVGGPDIPVPAAISGDFGGAAKMPAPTTLPWVVTVAEKARFDEMFKAADLDRDGFVSGVEIKDVFLQSGLPQPVLAHIWNLCDVKQVGKLNAEQFALSLWLIGKKVAGMELPAALTPEMVPPTFRPKPIPGPGAAVNAHPGPPHPPPPAAGLLDFAPTEAPPPVPYSNPELESLSKEIEDLMREKNHLEADVMQKEADVKIKNGEVRSLQTELDTLANALKQLENQKGMAQKRLDDLDSQRTSVQSAIDELKQQIEEERRQVDKLKNQAEEQEAELKVQEEELFSKKSELDKLRGEECKLEEAVGSQRARRDAQVKELAETRLELARVKHEVECLMTDSEKLTSAVQKFDSAIENGDVLGLTEAAIEDISFSLTTKEDEEVEGALGSSGVQDDPFKNQDPFAHHNGFDDDSGANDSKDVFGSDDPFRGESAETAGESSRIEHVDPFGGDPFQSMSGFGTSGTSELDSARNGFFNDPFAVGNGMDGNDDFFGSSTAQPSRLESVSPAPPIPAPAAKKSSGPPPRPAPPKNAPGRPPPPKASPSPAPMAVSPAAVPSSSFDPFSAPADASGDTNGGWTANFADFSAFDQAFSSPSSDDPWSSSSAWTPEEKTDLNANSKKANGVGSAPWGTDLESDPFFGPPVKTPVTKSLSEEDQVAWAKFDSLKIDQQQRDLAEREEAELQLAINLSLSDTSVKSEAGPI